MFGQASRLPDYTVLLGLSYIFPVSRYEMMLLSGDVDDGPDATSYATLAEIHPIAKADAQAYRDVLGCISGEAYFDNKPINSLYILDPNSAGLIALIFQVGYG